MSEVAELTDSALAARIGAAALDNDADTLDRLESERERRARTAAREALAVAERQRRADAAIANEAATLTASLDAQLADLRTQFSVVLGTLSATAPADAHRLVEKAYQLGRQAYALAHDLAGVTGDRRRFHARYDVVDQLVLHGGRAAEAFVYAQVGRPATVPTPWRTDLDRLRALVRPVTRIGNGG